MSPPPGMLLYNICNDALSYVVNNWPGQAEPLPDRQYVADGDVMWDCEQIVTHIEQVFPTQGDVTAQQWGATPPVLGIRACVFAVWLLRCVPDIDNQGEEIIVPTAAQMDEAARIMLQDGWLVTQLIVEGQQAGDIATCSGLTFENWTPVGPAGGYAGGVTRFRVQLL